MSELYVLFRVDQADYAVPASAVLHMESFESATKVPGTRPYVAGLVQVRSRVLPVVDLRVRFGLPAVVPTLDSRIVVVQNGTRVVGLLADSAREVMRIDPSTFRPPPELVVDQAAGFVTHIAEIGSRVVMLIDAGKVIGEETQYGGHDQQ